MNSSDYKITLDIHSVSAPISLNVKKGDTGRRICIGLMENGVPYKIKPGCYAVFTGKKPDEKILWNSCIIEGDTIIYEITEQTTNVVGWLPVQIRLYGAGGKLISSPDFVLIVDGVTVEDDELVSVSENEVTALTELITEFTVLGQEAPLNVNIENIADGADKTYSEIEAADEAGRMVLLNFKSWIYVMDKFGPIHPGEKAFYKFYPVITASNHNRVPRDAFVVYEDNTWVEIDTGFEHLTEEKVLDLIEDNAPDVLTEEEVITLIEENAPTPDWGAKYGEPGHIDGRTHYVTTLIDSITPELNWMANDTGMHLDMPYYVNAAEINSFNDGHPDVFSIDGLPGGVHRGCKFGTEFSSGGPPFRIVVDFVDDKIRIYSASNDLYGITPRLFDIKSVSKLDTSFLRTETEINEGSTDGYVPTAKAVVDYVKNNGAAGSSKVFDSILRLLKHAVYDTDMSDSLDKLEALIDGKPVYKWVIGLSGSYDWETNEALLDQNNVARAMCVAEGTGIPMSYGSNYQPTEMSPYSPVVIPEGAASITVKCPGFRISFHELKLVDNKWFRLSKSDTDPVADEVTYTFQSGLAKALYIKIRNANSGALSGVPEVPDITFNY